ncbi:hypothetical protein [uncultured Acidaminococcus sp.]|uniref:hypothetical protein n=1 Tax=uncultured Acidaminococcus sp. TaxID=352152 RepID=UPI0026188FD5|nr:hypothetical protein [uncultured Acidaminococcus sp.]
MQFRDVKTDRAYMIMYKKDKLGVYQYRPYYSENGHLRVVPGTHWWHYEIDAQDELRELARVNGWRKD